jgi:hypothetical protein
MNGLRPPEFPTLAGDEVVPADGRGVAGSQDVQREGHTFRLPPQGLVFEDLELFFKPEGSMHNVHEERAPGRSRCSGGGTT